MSSLGIVDWSVFGVGLVVPLGLTLLLGRGVKSNSAYSMGDRNLSPFPVALSLAVSYLSAVTISGVPGEVAYNSTLFPWTYLVSVSLALITIPNLAIPVFHKMHLTSVYEYLELRYSSRLVRWMGSLTYLFTIALYMGVAMYAPCISLAVLTGGPVWAFIVVTGVLSIMVTSLGGLRSVVWTDAWQAITMLGGLIAIIVLGTVNTVGGIEEVWNSAMERGRIVLTKWTADPRDRSSSLSIFFGQFIQWATIYTCHQTQVQRYCSIKTVSAARWSLCLNLFCVWSINLCAIFSGLVIFSYYKDCDPLETGDIRKTDELATFYVKEVLILIPGLVGLFLSALISGALSSVTSGLNSLATVIWEDFIAGSSWAQTTSEDKKVLVTRLLAGLFGLLCTLFSIGFHQLDGVLGIAATSIGILSGPLLSVFVLGLFTQINNKMGAAVGIILGHAATLWMAIGGLVNNDSKSKPYQLTTSSEGCNSSSYMFFNSSLGPETLEEDNSSSLNLETFPNNLTMANSYSDSTGYSEIMDSMGSLEAWYSVSPFLYPVVGFLVTSLTSLLVSVVSLLFWRPRPPPHLLLHPLARNCSLGKGCCVGGTGLPSVKDDSDRWDDHETHYRWPSPSLPPTLKKPRPTDTIQRKGRHGGVSDTLQRAGRSVVGPLSPSSDIINGYDNNSFDTWSEVGTGPKSSSWSTLKSDVSTKSGFYSSRL